MKKKILKNIIAIIFCVAFSSLIEIFGFNFNSVFSNHESPQNISYSKSQNQDDNTELKLNLDNQYVNKLVIDYKTNTDTKYALKYSYSDLYNNIKESVFSDVFDDSFNKSVININKTISNVSIEYKELDEPEIASINIDNHFHFNFTRFLSIFLTLVLFYSFFIFYKNGFKTEKIHIYFATTCLILGSIIILAQPSATFYSWDDQIHFQNTISLFNWDTTYSSGEYNSTEANIANSAGHGSINSIEEQNIQNEYYNSGPTTYSKNTLWVPTYNKVAYIPMSIGYHFSEIIGLPFSACFKIGKLCNLLFYIFLIAYAIKTIKIGKRLLSITALIPTNIFLASEYSYDPAVFAGITVFLAHLINLLLDKNAEFNFKTAIIMIASLSYACFTKAIYAPLLLLTLLIPNNRFKDNKQSHLVKIGLLSITILLLATFILPILSGSMDSDPRGGNTSVNQQLSLILSHPFDFLRLLCNTTVAQFTSSFVNGFNDFAYIPNIANISSLNFFFTLIFTIFFVFITDNKENRLTKKYRTILLCTTFTTTILIWVALYLSFTPVGSDTVNGVQPRYFLPLLFPILICLQPKNIQTKIKPKIYNSAIIIIPAVINLIMIISSILSTYAY